MSFVMRLSGFCGNLQRSVDGSWKRMVLFSGILLVVARNLGCDSWRQLEVRRSRQAIDRRPIFVPTSAQNVTVELGDRAVLKCRVQQLGAKTVTWRREREDHPLTIGLYTFAPDTRLAVDFNERTDEWSLIIKDVQESDEGVYHCQVTTKDEQDNTFDVQLNVKTVHVSGTEYVSIGGAMSLKCHASGDGLPNSPPDVAWFKDGRRLRSDSTLGLQITKKLEKADATSWLNIKHSRMSHAGRYQCLASNHDSSDILVHIVNEVQARLNKSNNSGVSAGRMASPMHNSCSGILDSTERGKTATLLLNAFLNVAFFRLQKLSYSPR